MFFVVDSTEEGQFHQRISRKLYFLNHVKLLFKNYLQNLPCKEKMKFTTLGKCPNNLLWFKSTVESFQFSFLKEQKHSSEGVAK